MIQVRELTSHAEMVAAHIAARARLYGNPRAANIERQPERVTRAVIRQECDEHIKAWRRHKWLQFAGKRKNASIRQIVETLCEGTPYTYGDVVGFSRRKDIVEHRHFVQAEVVRIKDKMSIAAVAKHLQRDHTSILYVIGKMEDRAGRQRNESPYRRKGIPYIFDGREMTLVQIGKLCEVHPKTLSSRIFRFKSLRRSLQEPLLGKIITYKGRPAYEAVGRHEPRQSA